MSENMKKPKIRSREYPAITLDKAIEFVLKLKDFPLNKPISYEIAAKTIGVSHTTKSFKYSVSSAKQFGLISTSAGNKISFLESAKAFMYPVGDSNAEKRLKIQCFQKPKLYTELIEAYEGKALPAENTLSNVLISQYGISQSVATIAAQVFIATATDSGAVQYGILNVKADSSEDVVQSGHSDLERGTEVVREDAGGSAKDEETIQSFNKNGQKKGYTFEIPMLNGSSALVCIPSDVTDRDLDYISLYIENMLPMFIENLKEKLDK